MIIIYDSDYKRENLVDAIQIATQGLYIFLVHMIHCMVIIHRLDCLIIQLGISFLLQIIYQYVPEASIEKSTKKFALSHR